MSSALAEAPTGAGEQEKAQPLRLFDIKQEPVRPTKLTVNVSGQIELDMSKKSDVEFWNSLKPGATISLPADFFVASEKTTHRRDSDGNVDAVPRSKSIKVDMVYYDGAGEE
jgi:hypothetical protein